MPSEEDPLLSEEETYYQEEDEFNFLAFRKWIPFIVIFTGASLYILCFALPSMFIPVGVPLISIPKVKKSEYVLRPVPSETISLWGIEPDPDSLSLVEIGTMEDEMKQSVRIPKDRHIIVGDIHGMRDEFQSLLSSLKFHPKKDHLVVLGDFFSKGPDSLGVIEDLISVNASCVLGNHEFYALQEYSRYHNLKPPHFEGDENKEDFKIVQVDPEVQLARKLQPDHVSYLNSCPLIFELGEVPIHSPKKTKNRKSGYGIAVHAGLRWDLTENLELQNAAECLQMRSYIGPYFNETTDDPKEENAVSWSKIWNWKHKKKLVEDNYVVYYGHDARRGLNLKQWAKGLDEGCVGGGNLSAMVIWQEMKKDKTTLLREKVVSVSCNHLKQKR